MQASHSKFKKNLWHFLLSFWDILGHCLVICPSLEYCSHIRGSAPGSPLHLLNKIRLRPSVSLTIQTSTILYSLSHIVVLLKICSFSTAIFTGNCSQEIKDIIPDPVRRARTTRSSKIYTSTPFPRYTT